MICDNCGHVKKDHKAKECINIDQYGCPCDCLYYFITESSDMVEELE